MLPLTLVIRTSGPPAAIVPSLRRTVAEDAGVALANATPFETLLEAPRAKPRLNAMLLATFAVAAVLLAAVGLFGVVATMVRQRTREMGIRMALGATSASVGRMVVSRGMVIAAVGTVAGLAMGLLVSRMLADLLYGVSPFDRPTIGLVTLMVFAVAALASYIPARWSTRIDPALALRSDG
jgi:putative ABC transport system permease protein